MALKTDYKDDIPAAGVSAPRKYQMVDNGDGTVSLVDATTYSQTGDMVGGADINATNVEVNKCTVCATGTLEAGAKSITLASDVFFEGGHIDVYVPSSKMKQLIPSGATVSDGNCTVTFDSSVDTASQIDVYCR